MADTSKSTLMEALICYEWYKHQNKEEEFREYAPEKILKKIDNVSDEQINTARNVVLTCLNELPELQNCRMSMMGNDHRSITPEWKYYGAKNGTSKTDLSFHDNDVTFSVKNGKGRLLNAGKYETLATISSAITRVDSSLLEDENFKQFKTHLNNLLPRKDLGKNVTELRKENSQLIKKSDENLKNIKKYLSNFLYEHDEVLTEVIKESMSGDIKFGKNTKASATHMLEIKGPDEVLINRIDDDDYINDIKSRIAITANHKSSKNGIYGTVSIVTK